MHLLNIFHSVLLKKGILLLSVLMLLASCESDDEKLPLSERIQEHIHQNAFDEALTEIRKHDENEPE
ncbi:hypothetical protein QLX67_11755, partial [Balneolaceae bacterium ANBcel3]|nr:hypothetical protein [Balneolaceae bacterium ANBcel3]